jgi:hypothetical protein
MSPSFPPTTRTHWLPGSAPTRIYLPAIALIWHHPPHAAPSIYKITKLLARPIGSSFKSRRAVYITKQLTHSYIYYFLLFPVEMCIRKDPSRVSVRQRERQLDWKLRETEKWKKRSWRQVDFPSTFYLRSSEPNNNNNNNKKRQKDKKFLLFS